MWRILTKSCVLVHSLRQYSHQLSTVGSHIPRCGVMAQCRWTVSTHSSAAPVTQAWSATNLLRRPTGSIEANDDCCVKCSATEEVKMCVDKQSGKGHFNHHQSNSQMATLRKVYHLSRTLPFKPPATWWHPHPLALFADPPKCSSTRQIGVADLTPPNSPIIQLSAFALPLNRRSLERNDDEAKHIATLSTPADVVRS
ncbi:hypothetical protein EmuJ_000411700 [Echinococcus multilocularis]|uniref:Uncharacterized protein n=1 Tax=Echinococcus multilocularis TaxID=6211 RepID=A0A068Y3Z3_ECHMU|nr:hypothetical protein EmuJ_000411700 [Echinococcus multilocularis]